MYEQPVTQPHKKMTNRTLWGLILLIAPSTLGILTLLMSFVVNYYIDLDDDTANSIVQIVFMLLNIIVSITWLPGVVVGIILLATKPTSSQPVSVPQNTEQGVVQPIQATPQQVAYSPEQLAELSSRKNKYLIWGLVSLIVPTVSGIIAVILLFVNISVSFGGSANDIETTLLTTFTIITGAIAYIGFIPGIVVGILLLVKRSSLQPK